MSLRSVRWPLVVILFAVFAFWLLKQKRTELVDFAVPRMAAMRTLHAEPLYRPEDGHYQFKYLPAFALVMIPFTWPPKPAAEVLWFALTVAMTWALVRLSLRALPDRRHSEAYLVWLTLLLNGKFLVKELAFGQFNLPLGLLLIGAVIAATRRRFWTAGALIGLGVFVKPYALVLVPWLVWACGVGSLAPFSAVLLAGLAAPMMFYGWQGNLHLLQEWFRTVTQTTAPNLLTFENASFAAMWARWSHPGLAASMLAAMTAAAAMGLGLRIMARRRTVPQPAYLEGAFFFLLVPLLSPQGWDYVLLLGMPAYMLLVDRFGELSLPWRMVVLLGFVLTSFAIFDLYRRALYLEVMALGGTTIGAMLLALALARIRWKQLA